MRGPVATSFALHAMVVAFAAYGLPRWWDPRIEQPAPVMLELVTVAERTVQKAEEKRPEPEPVKPEEKQVEVDKTPVPKPPDPPKEAAPPLPRRVEAPPPPPPPEPKTEVVAKQPEPVPPPEPKPEVAEKKPEPKPEPEKQPEKKPEPVASVPKPMSKPVLEKPQEPEKAKPKFDLNQIQALLDKRQSPESTERVEARKRSADAAPKRQQIAAADSQMTISEIDAIRAQIAKCWSLPAGAKDVANMRVQVRVFLRPDGSLERPPELVDSFLLSGDGYFRSFAESARRAVQMCSPLQHLPVEKYEQWRELTINFDPREMLGG